MALKRKNPKSNLNNHHTVLLEGGIIVALGLALIAMNVNIHGSKDEEVHVNTQQVVKMKKVKQTEQKHKTPPPSTPVVPVQVPNDAVVQNQNISFNVDITSQTKLPAPPKPEHEGSGQSTEQIFMAVQSMPKMKISRAKLQSKVNYPASCRNAGIEGRVIVQFVVNKQGVPTNVHVVRGIGGGCDQAAVKAVKKYARFTPGRQQGKPVKVRMSLPILFRLRSY